MIDLIKNKPPLTIFLLCLVFIVVTLFYFVYYIRTEEFVPDSDKNQEWYSLLEHFNKLKCCVGDSFQHNSDNLFSEFISLTTVYTSVNIDTSQFFKYNSVEGVLSMDGWASHCTKKELSWLQIKFDLPKDAQNKTMDICVQIIGPQEYLPTFSKQSCMLNHNKQSKKIKVGYITTQPRTHLDEKFCQDGTLTTLLFNTNINKNNFANFLSSVERNVIYIHLLWSSCLLLFLTICIVIYAFLYNEKQQDGYVEKCTSLLRK